MSWFEFIHQESANYLISLLCEEIGVSIGAHYSILKKGLSDSPKKDEICKSKILEIQQTSKYN